MQLTESSYGFIGEVLTSSEGSRYIKMHAMSEMAWTGPLPENCPPHAGLEFQNLDTLFGAAITSGKPVISNAASRVPHGRGIPEGHPLLDSFLGLPIYNSEKLVGAIGLANRPGGYDEKLVEYLHHSCCAAAWWKLSQQGCRKTAEDVKGERDAVPQHLRKLTVNDALS